MTTAAAQPGKPIASKWPAFCALMSLLFLARGLFILTVLPPLEGWDEYQHVAYIEFLRHEGRPPVLGQDMVPLSLHDEIVRVPHGTLALQQLRKLGALSYDEFWNAPARPAHARDDAGRLRLYQAQHAPFYYRLVSPLYGAVKARWGFLAAVSALRLLNVALGAAAVYVALSSIGRLVTPGTWRYLIGLLVATQPLYLLNCARVANDALALLLGTAVVASLLTLGPRRWYLTTAAIGVLLGFSILAKTINFALLPLALFVFAHLAWRRIVAPRRAAHGCALLLAACAAVTVHYLTFNLRTFGLLTPMQEAVANRADGKGASDLLAAARAIDWYQELARRILRHSVWVAGWSYLSADWSAADDAGLPILSHRWPVRLHEWLVYAALAGALMLLSRRRRAERWILALPGAGWRTAAMAVGLTAALGYHMVQTQMAHGSVATNIWYGCVAFPWLLMLLVQGLRGLPGPRTATVLAIVMLVVFVSQEVYGTLVQMSRHYYGSSLWNATAMRRAESLSPGPSCVSVGLAALLAAWLAMGIGLKIAFTARPAQSLGGMPPPVPSNP